MQLAAFALKRISRQLQRLPRLALVYVVIILNPTEFSSWDLRGRGIFVNFTCLEELSMARCVFCAHTHTEKGKLLKQRKAKAQKTFFESLSSGFQGLRLNITWLWFKISKIKVNVSIAEGQQLRKYRSDIVNRFSTMNV